MMRARWSGYVLFALGIAACGGRDLVDLERMVDEATRPPPHSASVPTVDRELAAEYGAVAERSPFEPFTEIQGTAASAAPDRNRRPQPLERFPLGQLEIVGTLGGRDRMLALIRDPERITHVRAVGDYLGRDHGRITAVRESGVDIIEHIEDGRGGWTIRARALALRVPDVAEESSAGLYSEDSEE